MNENEKKVEEVADMIVSAVSDAMVAIAPATGAAAPGLVLGAKAIEAIYSVLMQLGHGPDAVQQLLDAQLAETRRLTDEALAAKHHRG